MRLFSEYKIFVIGIIILMILIIISISLFFNKDREGGGHPVPTVRPTATGFLPVTITVTPVWEDGVDTGASEDKIDLPESEVSAINKAFDLEMQLPIENEYFKLTYDENFSKFILDLKEPVVENEERFEKWLIENGYDVIPRTKFNLEE